MHHDFIHLPLSTIMPSFSASGKNETQKLKITVIYLQHWLMAFWSSYTGIYDVHKYK